MKTWTQWYKASLITLLCGAFLMADTISFVSANKLIKNARGWKGLVEIADDTMFSGTTFASLPVSNSQQCLRLCWLYKACTLLSYDMVKGTCYLTSLDVPDMTSYYQEVKNIVTVDMRTADVDEPKPRGCDQRPCDVDHLCVPVVMTSSYRCLSTVLKFCPSPVPRVAKALARPDGINSVTYQCQDGFLKSATKDVSTCDRATGQWSAVDVTCTYVDCGLAPDVANATKVGNDSFYNARVTYTCFEGHVASSSSMTVVCQENSQWTTSPSDCLHVVCPQPVDLPNANVQLHDRREGNRPSAISGEIFARSYGGQATHSCIEGFQSASGNVTSVCQTDGSWALPSSFSCSVVDCGQPTKVANAWTSYNTSHYQSYVDYTCHAGYRNGTEGMRLQCNANGQWGGPEVVCKPVDCGTPPEMSFAEASYNATVFGSQVIYSCIWPTIPYSNTTGGSTCKEDGNWSSENNLECIRCGTPPSIGNGSYKIEKGRGRKPVYYTGYQCDEGFAIRQGSLLVCMVDKWIGTLASCIPAVCSQPDEVQNANAIYNDTSYNSMLIYECHEGFKHTNGASNYTCSSRGFWEAPGTQGLPVECQPVKCGSPPEVANAEILVSDYSFQYNTTVGYKCLDNTVLTSPSNTIRCAADGWDTSTPIRCEYIPCGQPPEVPNSDPDVEMTKTPIRVTYTCHEGFNHHSPGVSSKVCIDNTWEVKVVACVPVDCGKPPTVKAATAAYQGTVYGSVATYTCEEHPEADWDGASSSVSTTCLANGTWSAPSTLVNCEPQNCGIPPTKPNTNVLFESTAIGSVASYVCREGFTFGSVASLPVTCSSTGKWNGEDLNCTKVDCGIPPAKPNTDVLFESTAIGSVASYNCDEGFTFGAVASLLVMCSSTGKWSGLDLNCTKVDCGIPPNLPSAKTSYNSTTYRSEVIYSCTENYTATGTTMKTCSATGNWTGDDSLECASAEKCREAPSVQHALITYAANRTNGSTAVYACADGYQLARNISTITCLGNGQWSSERVECVLMRCGEVPLVKNSNWVVYSLDNQSLVAEYSCRKGYKAIDDLIFRNCTTDGAGNWSSNFVECAPDQESFCPEPEKMHNASFTVTSRRPGGQVIYTCNAGLEHWWFESRHCTERGVWSDLPMECRVVNCGVPPDVEHAVKKYTDTRMGSKVEYICNSGYRHSSSSFKMCDEDRAWSKNLVECLSTQTRVCKAPYEDSYSTVSFSSLMAGNATATFTCVRGYTASVESYTKFCGEDMQWRSSDSSSPSLCHPVDCGNPPEVHNAVKNVKGTRFESTTTYTCRDGFRRSGPEYRTCKENGRWGDGTIECIQENDIKCPEPVNLENSVILVNSYRVGGSMVIACVEGYTGGGKGVCSERGQWQWTTDGCQPLTCDEPPRVTDANLNYTETHFGALTVYECNPEHYRQTGPYRSLCSKEGTWTQPVSTCQHLHKCLGVPESDVADVVEGVDEDGIFLRYVCKDNYVSSVPVPIIRRCLDSGQWPLDPAECQPIGVCASPPDIPNASLREIKALTPDDKPYIFIAVYTCETGYALEPQSPDDVTTIDLACDKSTKWHPSYQSCVLIKCRNPQFFPPFFTRAAFTVEVSNTTYMSQARFSCIPPRVGDFNSVCQANGQWSAVDFKCVVPCGHPPEVANGTLETSSTSTEQMLPPDVLLNFGQPSTSTSESSEVWKVNCHDKFTYLGPNVTCFWNSTRQADQWEGLEEGMCVQVDYGQHSTELVIDTHVDTLLDYFTALEVCVEGIYQPTTNKDIASSFLDMMQSFPKNHALRLYIEPQRDKARLQYRRNRDRLFNTFDSRKVIISPGHRLSFCLKADFKLSQVSATLDDIPFDEYPIHKQTQMSDFNQFVVRFDMNIQSVKVVYFKN